MIRLSKVSGIALSAGIAICGISQIASATDYTWQLGSGDPTDVRNEATNWNPNGLPTAANGQTQTNIIHFADTGSTTPTMIGAINYWPMAMYFDANAQAYTFTGTSGGATYLAFDRRATNPGDQAIVNNSAQQQVVNISGGKIGLMGWINSGTQAGGSLVINGAMSVGDGASATNASSLPYIGFMGSNNIYFNVDPSINAAGNLSGGAWSSSIASSMQTRARGRVFMTNFSGTAYLGNIGTTFSGSFHLDSVANGALRLTNNNSLGTASNTTTGGGIYIYGGTTGNATLELSNNISVSRRLMQMDGRSGAVADDPHILNVSGNNTLNISTDWNTGINVPITTNTDNTGGFFNGGNWNIQSDAGKLTITGGTMYNTQSVPMNLQLMGAGDGEIASSIQKYLTNNSLNIIKKGTGTWIFSGANTYPGTTTVTAGTLLINGTHVGNDNGTPVVAGDYTVQSGGKLGGNGSISANVIVQSGGIYAPGSSIDQQDIVGNLSVAGKMEIEYEGVTNTIDRTDVTGQIDLTGGTISLLDLGSGDSLDNPAYILASYGTLVGNPAIELGIPAGYHLDYAYNDGNSSNHIALVTPEPATLGFLALGVLGMLRRRAH